MQILTCVSSWRCIVIYNQHVNVYYLVIYDIHITLDHEIESYLLSIDEYETCIPIIYNVCNINVIKYS